jgi:glycosyltransferase involved in cell wall biosynthesis
MPERAVAYVLKGYPRLSELFIASEIYRLEQAGLPMRLYVLKPRDEDVRHAVVDRIAARPLYLPDATSLREQPFASWLRANLPAFAPSLRRTLRRRPLGLLRAAAAAGAQSVRARRTRWSAPRKLYVKEFLRASALADVVLDDPEVDHLHAHFAHGTTTVTWLAAMITGLPFSFTGHAKDVWAPSLNPAGLLRRKLLAASFAVTCTEANRRRLEDVAPEARVHRVYHGLNADFAVLAQSTNGRPVPTDDVVRVLAVGRQVPKKGFDVLVRACALLAAEGVDVELVVVGENGEAGPQLQRLVAELELDARVRFRGPSTQVELLREYRSAAVFCAPSRIVADGDRDGIPNVLMEAMASGVPVVATDVSGIPELVQHGVNGLLVTPDDPRSLAAAIGSLARDRALAQRLGAAGRATVAEHFDGERLTRELAGLFRSVR